MNLSCKVSYCVAILFIGTIVSELFLSFSLPSKKAFSVNRGEFFYGICVGRKQSMAHKMSKREKELRQVLKVGVKTR